MFHPIFYRPRCLGNSGWQQATSNWHSTHATRGKLRAAVSPELHSNQAYEHLKKFELGCDRKGRGRQCRQSGLGCRSAGRGPRPAAAAVPAVRTRMHQPRPQCRQSGLGCRPLEAPPPFPPSLHSKGVCPSLTGPRQCRQSGLRIAGRGPQPAVQAVRTRMPQCIAFEPGL
jgi:hypothetical protein